MEYEKRSGYRRGERSILNASVEFSYVCFLGVK